MLERTSHESFPLVGSTKELQIMEGGSDFGAIKCNTQVKLKWMEGIGSDLDVEANPQV